MTKIFTSEIAHANVDASSASNLLDVMRTAAHSVDQQQIVLAMAVYKFQDTGAWWIIDGYSGRPDGFVQAVSDAVRGPQRIQESDEDYKKRWQSYRSSAYDLAKAGWLATLLDQHDWGTDFSARPYHLAIVSKLVGHASMKGDMDLTLSTAANLLDRVASGELVDQGKLRNEVKRLMGESTPEAKGDLKTLMVSVKVSGLDEDQIARVKRMVEAYMKDAVALAGGKV